MKVRLRSDSVLPIGPTGTPPLGGPDYRTSGHRDFEIRTTPPTPYRRGRPCTRQRRNSEGETHAI
jgi:hypothetical protein